MADYKAPSWNFLARFWSRATVLSDSECWKWNHGLNSGYPAVRMNGKTRRCSQIAWEVANGRPFPDGLRACHVCDNPLCVNPSHIYAGTAKDNARDMIERNRHANASATACAKGHAYTPENTHYFTRDGGPRRRCRACQRTYLKKYRSKKANAGEKL